MKILKLFPT